jgi:hypothetical protein
LITTLPIKTVLLPLAATMMLFSTLCPSIPALSPMNGPSLPFLGQLAQLL